jgi:hypothetical protein
MNIRPPHGRATAGESGLEHFRLEEMPATSGSEGRRRCRDSRRLQWGRYRMPCCGGRVDVGVTGRQAASELRSASTPSMSHRSVRLYGSIASIGVTGQVSVTET